MRNLTAEEKKSAWQEVEKEFPDDRVMQDVHYSRLLRYYEVKDLPERERFSRFLRRDRPARAQSTSS